MKKLIMSMAMTLVMATIAKPGEYRNFTNQQGKTIVAKMVEYDSDGDKVQLELKNGKRACIELSTLSEADQAYIRDMRIATAKPTEQKEESKPINKILSKEQVKAIAEEYEKALEEKDTDTLKRLFYKSKWRGTHVRGFWDRIENVRIGTIKGNNIYVIVDGCSEALCVSGWIQLTPEGKIKYCPLIAPHPVEEATVEIRDLVHVIKNDRDYETAKNQFIETVGKLGIPLYDLHQDLSAQKIMNNLDKIGDWLIENGGEYDNSEPKLFLPDEQMKLVKQTLKSLF